MTVTDKPATERLPVADPPVASGAGGATRIEGVDKVTGRATYAYEYLDETTAYGWVVPATIARGRVVEVDVDGTVGRDGVLAVIWAGNVPPLAPTGSAFSTLLQSDRVAFRGQVVALVVAETAEGAREGARTLRVHYAEEPHRSVLDEDTPATTPDSVNGGEESESSLGDAAAAFALSPVRVDATYTTPALHNHPMEPHACTAVWDGPQLTLYDSNQGGNGVQRDVAAVFGLDPGAVRVVSAHIGGGFGSKGTTRPPAVLAALAAKVTDRAVRVALTRPQLFDLVGYRTPTIQRIRLGADTKGTLLSISHEALSQTATIEEFTEQSATCTRVMYAAENRRTAHRVAALDVAVPSWMRAPGEAPGMFALETAMDELAVALDLDPIDLRIRNEPTVDPEKGVPFSSRNLLACLREGARRFGWADRPVAGHRDGRWLVGTGVAAATYPRLAMPATARIRVLDGGRFEVAMNATDIGTGARTLVRLVAAEELGVPSESVEVRIGDTDLPRAGIAGGSMGTSSWGAAVVKAARGLRHRLTDEHGGRPVPGVELVADTTDDLAGLADRSRHAFGAQFVEVRVDADTGEVRASRMVGVFAAGRVVNPVTARSQFIGGMTMGLSMALHEAGRPDAEFGGFANHDLAGYHVAAHADVPAIEVAWLDETDTELGAFATKGIGEIGIVGTAAAVGNAVFRATGVRLRQTPMTPDLVLAGLMAR